MKTAVLYNPNAGKRISVKLVLQRLSNFFAGDELLVANPALEIPGVHITPVSILQTANSNYVSYLNNMVDALVQAGADRFVCVGGDGTATYVRTALYAAGQDLPIMGVAAGTANVGPIVSVTLDQLDGRNVQQAKEVCYDGIAVLEGNRLISLAFNDLVVGDTFLSTVDGRPCNTSVSALVKRGEIVVQSPSTDIVTDEFHVKLNGLTCRPSVREIHQIIVSAVAHENHYGRAIYGPIGKCDWSEKKGVIALCDHIAVTYEENDAGMNRFSTMQYLLFGPHDQVELHGFTPKACLICDGNPYLMTENSIQLKYLPHLVKTLTL